MCIFALQYSYLAGPHMYLVFSTYVYAPTWETRKENRIKGSAPCKYLAGDFRREVHRKKIVMYAKRIKSGERKKKFRFDAKSCVIHRCATQCYTDTHPSQRDEKEKIISQPSTLNFSSSTTILTPRSSSSSSPFFFHCNGFFLLLASWSRDSWLY